MSRKSIEDGLRRAVRHFWRMRERQAKAQGRRTGKRDRGARSAVTGGAQLDGFSDLIRKLVVGAGINDAAIFKRTRVELPGYYRAEKKWDLVIVVEGRLLATIEFKSHVGPSFSNNFNNRTEEALGNATDYWAAFREGAFSGSPRPWLGYLMLLEDCEGSTKPVGVAEPHFKVFEEFRDASYAKRYQILLTKMVRERLYDAASLILSPRSTGLLGTFSEPCRELSFLNFSESLVARAVAYVKTRYNTSIFHRVR